MLKKFFWLKFIFAFTVIPVFLPVLFHPTALSAQNQETDNYSKILDKAQELYYEGRFTESVNLVKSCLTDTGISPEQRVKAYKILSQVALARDNEAQAKEILRQILKINPEYNPTIEQEPPKFVQLVASVRGEIQKQTATAEPAKVEVSQSNHWRWYTAGAAAAVGIGAAILLGGNDGGNEKDGALSKPPPWPQPK